MVVDHVLAVVHAGQAACRVVPGMCKALGGFLVGLLVGSQVDPLALLEAVAKL